jgi:hypothetical protein
MIRCGLLLVCLSVSMAQAEDASVLSKMKKSLELPAHRSLIDLVKAPGTVLAPFETDGCSGGMSWSWRVVADVFPDFNAAQGAVPPWETCCVIHDEAYHTAGGARDPEASYAARLTADEALRQCVANPPQEEVDAVVERYEVSLDQVRLAYDLIADSMFNAVRFGGGPCSGLPWRWGFGYPTCLPGL